MKFLNILEYGQKRKLEMQKIKFVRFGGLSGVKQKHYVPEHDEDKSFHNPPRKKGIYAFQHTHIDKFLLGATDHPAQKNGKTYWIKDEEGNKLGVKELTWDDDGFYIPSEKLKKILKKKKIKLSEVYYQPKKYGDDDCDFDDQFLTAYVKPKIFTYEGELWHHFIDEAKPGEILDRSGDWILSTYEDYCKIFKRTKHKDLSWIHETYGEWKDEKIKFNEMANKVYKYTGGLSVASDHLEVFIEKV